jgi:sorting nexin-8
LLDYILSVKHIFSAVNLTFIMSLFGDTPNETTPRRTKTASSLFDDANVTPTRNSGLFADDGNSNSDSPWGFSSTKRAAKSTLVKTLLPGNAVPELYVDVFDKLYAETGGSGTGISAGVAKNVLRESKIDEESSGVIMQTVMSDETKELGRGEVNVLLALIGLAQEGDEITLDGVDERRSSKLCCVIS